MAPPALSLSVTAGLVAVCAAAGAASQSGFGCLGFLCSAVTFGLFFFLTTATGPCPGSVDGGGFGNGEGLPDGEDTDALGFGDGYLGDLTPKLPAEER